MIRREHIKQAIEAISGRSPEIGYSLDEMLGMGLIDVAPESEQDRDLENFFFLFDGDRVLVNRVLFFDQGTVPIEQGLLVKYGELVKRHELEEKGAAVNFQQVFREIHEAGLRLAVNHEIDYALFRLRKKIEGLSEGGGNEKKREFHITVLRLLEEIREDNRPLRIPEDESNRSYLYGGIVDKTTPAHFLSLPISMATLMQVADLNMEFFHLRFILTCLIRGLERNLMACVAENGIVGLLYLTLREQFLKRDLEIKYLATLRGKTWNPGGEPFKPPKGVGTFLVAGTWLLLKNELSGIRELVLDAEVGARQFYEALGFEARGLSGYVLRNPKGYLLRAILNMTRHCRDLRESVIREIRGLLGKQIKRLRKKADSEKAAAERTAVIGCIRECLRPEGREEFARAVLEGLLKYRKKIPEAEDLIQWAAEEGSEKIRAHIDAAGGHR